MKQYLPNPLAVLVSALVSVPLASTEGAVWILVFLLVLLPFDRLMRARSISRRKGEDRTSTFLLTFSRLLSSESPGEALVTSFGTSMPNGETLSDLLVLRDGRSVPSVMRRMSKRMPTESQTFEAIATLLSFDKESSRERLRSFAKMREERKRVRQDLEVRLKAISMRFKILSMISSASLAVLAFVSPILGSFFSDQRLNQVAIESLIRFDFQAFSAFYSLVLISSYLPTKVLPFVGGSGSMLRASASYLLTYLLLIITLGTAF